MAEQLNKARASLNSLIVNAKVGHGIKSPAVSSETYLKHLDTSFAASKSNFLAMGNSSPLQAGAVGKAMQKLQERYATSTEQLVRETESNFQRIQADAIRIKSDAIKATEGINKINEDRTKFLSKIKFKDTKGNLGNTVKLDDTKSFWEAFTNNANVQQLLETVVGLDTETTGLIEKASAVPVTLGLGSIGKNAVAGGKGVKNWVLSYGDTGKTAEKLIDAMNVGIENGVGSIKESAKQLRAQLGYTERDTVNIAKNNFRFAPLIYLEAALTNIDKMPQSTYDEIIEKSDKHFAANQIRWKLCIICCSFVCEQNLNTFKKRIHSL